MTTSNSCDFKKATCHVGEGGTCQINTVNYLRLIHRNTLPFNFSSSPHFTQLHNCCVPLGLADFGYIYNGCIDCQGRATRNKHPCTKPQNTALQNQFSQVMSTDPICGISPIAVNIIVYSSFTFWVIPLPCPFTDLIVVRKPLLLLQTAQWLPWAWRCASSSGNSNDGIGWVAKMFMKPRSMINLICGYSSKWTCFYAQWLLESGFVGKGPFYSAWLGFEVLEVWEEMPHLLTHVRSY